MLQAPETTEIFVVRHAEVYNPRDIIYGRLPRFGLSEKGYAQAERAGRFLSSRTVDGLYSSPLLRARQTSTTIARYHPTCPIHIASGLLEVRTGFQGQPNSILKPGFSFYEPKVAPGDESMSDVLKRMLTVCRTVVRSYPGGRVIMVSHGDPITILRLGLEGRSLTVENLHSTVYAMRASVMQVLVGPNHQCRLGYFDVAGEGPA
ncbi:MAG: histidine phosphatase family protein [Chloroflexota bacterium]